MKVEDLVPGKEYVLQHSGKFCHYVSMDYESCDFDTMRATFIGAVQLKNTNGLRAIFYGYSAGISAYVMYSCKGELDYIGDGTPTKAISYADAIATIKALPKDEQADALREIAAGF